MEYGKLIIENDEVKSIEIYDLEKFVLSDCQISDTTASNPMPFFNEKGKYIGYEHKYSGDKKSINIEKKKYKDGYYFYLIGNSDKTFDVYVVLKKQGHVLKSDHLEIILGIDSFNKKHKDHSYKLRIDKETGIKYYKTLQPPLLDENLNISIVEHELDFERIVCLDGQYVFQRVLIEKEKLFFTFNEKHKGLDSIIKGRQPIMFMFLTTLNADRFADFPWPSASDFLGEDFETIEGEHDEDYIFIASYEDLTNRRNEHIQSLYYDRDDYNFKNGIDTYIEGFSGVSYSKERPDVLFLNMDGDIAVIIFEGFDMSRLVYKKFKSFSKLIDRRFGEDEDLYDLSERRIKNFLKKTFE